MASPDEIRAWAVQYMPLAQQVAQRLNTTPDNVLSQWALETGYGKSVIPGTHNLGNIKDLSGGGVAARDNALGTTSNYRAYASPEAGAADYGDLLARRYPNVAGTRDPVAFGRALQAGGYAEDPNYPSKIGGVQKTLAKYASDVLGFATGSTPARADELSPQQRGYVNAQGGPQPPPGARLTPPRAGGAAGPASAGGAGGAKPPADEWDALDAKYTQPAAPQADAKPADPWDELDAQYAAKGPNQAATGTAPPAAPVQGPSAASPPAAPIAAPAVPNPRIPAGYYTPTPQGVIPGSEAEVNRALHRAPQSKGFFGDLGASFMQHLENAGYGATQTGANLLTKGARGLLGEDSPLTQAAEKNTAAFNRDVAQREADYQATQANGAGTVIGAVAGDTVPYLAMPFGAAGRVAGEGVSALAGLAGGSGLAEAAPWLGRAGAWLAPKVGNVLAGGGLSALGSTAAPVTSGASSPDAWAAEKNKQMNTAAVVGGAAPVVADAVGGVVKTGVKGAKGLWNMLAPGMSEGAAQKAAAKQVLTGIEQDVAKRNAALVGQAAPEVAPTIPRMGPNEGPQLPPVMGPPKPGAMPPGAGPLNIPSPPMYPNMGPRQPFTMPPGPTPPPPGGGAGGAAGGAAGPTPGSGLLGALSSRDEAQRVAQRMSEARPIVPGSMPTAADVAESPTIAAIQKAASNRPEFKIPLQEQAEQANRARFNLLGSLAAGGEEGGGSAALRRARNEITDPLYAQANEIEIPVSDSMRDLMQRPSMKQGINRARELASESGLPFGLNDEAQTMTGRDAHQMKKAFDAILYDSKRELDPAMKSAIQDTRNQFMGELEDKIPVYGQAREIYREMSPQINGTEVAEELMGDLRNASMNSTDPQITFNAFKTKLNKYLNQQKYPIDPEIRTNLLSIQSDLQRATRANAIRAGGSDTLYNIAADNWFSKMTGKQNVLGGALASGIGGGLGSLLGPGGAVAGAALGAAGKAAAARSEDAINREMARLLLNPQEFGAALQQALQASAPTAPSAAATLTQRIARPAILGGLLGAFNH